MNKMNKKKLLMMFIVLMLLMPMRVYASEKSQDVKSTTEVKDNLSNKEALILEILIVPGIILLVVTIVVGRKMLAFMDQPVIGAGESANEKIIAEDKEVETTEDKDTENKND